MEWLGHADSEMVSRYYHFNDVGSRQKMTVHDIGCDADGTARGPQLLFPRRLPSSKQERFFLGESGLDWHSSYVSINVV